MDTRVSQFQQRLWTAQRVAWVVFTVFLIFAALGAFGSTGPLSNKSADAGPLRISYEAVMRAGTTSEIEWQVSAPDTGAIEIDVGHDFRAAFSIESIEPEPEREELREDGARLQFRNRESGPRVIRAAVQARRFGRYKASFRAAGGDWTTLSILVLP